MAKNDSDWDAVEFLAAHNNATRIMIQLLVLALHREGALDTEDYRSMLLRYADEALEDKSPKDRKRHDLIKQLLRDLAELLKMEPTQ